VDNVKGFLAGRRSKDRVISGDLGRFDDFASALLKELTVAPQAPVGARKNLFKFLDSYQEDQRSWFHGRRGLTRRLVRSFKTDDFATLFLYGKPKVGKTSFVRAGLIPELAKAGYDAVYLRCRLDVEPQLVAELEKKFSLTLAGQTWDQIAQRLAEANPKPIVIFLDQLERLCRAAAAQTDNALLRLMQSLSKVASPKLRLVLIATADVPTLTFMMHWPDPRRDVCEITPLPARRVESIIRHAARRGGVPLNPRYVEALCDEYERSLGDATERRSFTLTHVQTICYYLVRGYQPTSSGYDALPAGLLAALESVREESSLVDFLDDLPADERRLVRTFLKAVCDPDGNTRKVLDFLRKHFPEIKEDRYPEPIV
jgi:hypothetical protein